MSEESSEQAVLVERRDRVMVIEVVQDNGDRSVMRIVESG